MKPIVFFDLETTGNSKDYNKIRIIEISARKVDPESLEMIDKCYFKCSNGDIPIDPDATERHGMTEEDLIGCPTFDEVAEQVYDFFDGCDVGGYYCTVFDIPILYYSFLRANIIWKFKELKNYDIYSLWHKFNSGKLSDVYKRYTGLDLENAHEADADIAATIAVYKEQRKRGEEFEDGDLMTYSDTLDIAGNFKYRINENGAKEVIIDFGKWKGTRVDLVDQSYIEWIARNESFSPDTRFYASKILEKLKSSSI